MTTLGIGTRVWIGWCPPHENPRQADWARLRTGTIKRGPVHVTSDQIGRRVYVFSYQFRVQYAATYWHIAVDGGGDVAAEEWMLTPIDDGETEADRARGMAVET